MECPSCAQENPNTNRFCGGCGAALERVCPRCGHHNPGDHRFCGQCGEGFTANGARRVEEERREPLAYTPKHLADKILTSRSAMEGERKHVTVLFADVKGSMELSGQIDPEAWRRILEHFFRILTDGVHRFEGTVNQYTGDGIMALFGAPIAHEDHAQRACYAALHLRERLRDYADELRRTQGLSFSTRMGLNSGEVIVGKIGTDLRMDYTAQGYAVGLAQRMETIAEPGCVFLTGATQRLVEGFFSTTDLGTFDLKGVEEPVRVFELADVGRHRTRLDVSRSRGLSRFVGRHDEMTTINAALDRAQEGRGQVVGVVGEAGVGKSRLCFEFVERCRAREIPVYEAHCPAHGKNVPFLPILELFRNYFGITASDTAAQARQKVAGALLLLDPALQETLPVLFEFLGVGDPASPSPSMEAEARQRQLFAVIHGAVRAQTERGMVTVALIDDLHWIDAGSDSFVAQLVDAFEGSRSLLLLNFRPEYGAQWATRSHYQQLPLVPLGSEAVRELVISMLGTDPSVRGLPEQIERWTGGNPFFTEEVIQSLIEGEELTGAPGAYRLTTNLDRLEVPSSVQAVLAARIDRLPELSKQALQTAAVLGKEFSSTILSEVAELAAPDLAQALDRLKTGDFIFERALYPVAEYAFKHPLSHEVAYESQLQDRKAATHARAAGAIEAQETERADEHAALIAHHWERAGKSAEAIHWHERAGFWTQVSDPSSSFHHWERIRDLVNTLEPTPETLSRGAMACSQMLNISWRLGRPAEDGTRAFRDGKAFAERAGDVTQLSLLNGAYSVMRGLTLGLPEDYLTYSSEGVRLADQTEDKRLQCAMRVWLTHAHLFLGNFSEAERIASETLDRIPAEDPNYALDLMGISPLGAELTARATSRAWMGRKADVVRAAFLETIALAGQREYREPQVYACSTYAIWSLLVGDDAVALKQGQTAFRLSEDLRSSDLLWSTWSATALGRALLATGQPNEALQTLESLVAAIESTVPTHANWGLILASLSAALRSIGRIREARERAEEAVEFARGRRLRWDLLPWFECARTRLAQGELAAATETLDGLDEYIQQTGAAVYQPHLHECRANVAAGQHNESLETDELREAHRLFAEIGAYPHADRIAERLAS